MRRSAKTTRARRSQRGTAMLEAALAMPLFILILFGSVEFGLLFMRNQVLMNSTHQGARIASLARQTCFPADVKTEVDDVIIASGSQLGMILNGGHVTVTGACVSGDNVTVKVVYPNDIILLEGFLGTPGVDLSVPIGAEVMMRNES